VLIEKQERRDLLSLFPLSFHTPDIEDATIRDPRAARRLQPGYASIAADVFPFPSPFFLEEAARDREATSFSRSKHGGHRAATKPAFFPSFLPSLRCCAVPTWEQVEVFILAVRRGKMLAMKVPVKHSLPPPSPPSFFFPSPGHRAPVLAGEAIPRQTQRQERGGQDLDSKGGGPDSPRRDSNGLSHPSFPLSPPSPCYPSPVPPPARASRKECD